MRFALARRAAPAALVASVALAACQDGAPTMPDTHGPDPSSPRIAAEFDCEFDVLLGDVSCVEVGMTAALDGPAAIFFPNAKQVMDLVIGDKFFDGEGGASLDLSVRSNLTQPIGTLDGTTTSSGVRLLVTGGPANGVVFDNPDGVDGGVKFFDYTLGNGLLDDGILSPFEMSGFRTLTFSNAFANFNFKLALQADHPWPTIPVAFTELTEVDDPIIDLHIDVGKTWVRTWDKVYLVTNRNATEMADFSGVVFPSRISANWRTIVAAGFPTFYSDDEGATWRTLMNGAYTGVHVLPGGATFLVGQSQADATPTVMRWNRAQWYELPDPVPGYPYPVLLSGVWAASPQSVWVVGTATTGPYTESIITHWDGTTWTMMDHPSQLVLIDIWGRAADDIYAIGMGSSLLGPGLLPATVLHWNGESWTDLGLPPTPTVPTSIFDDGYGGVYVTTLDPFFYSSDSGVFFNWDGEEWRELGIEPEVGIAAGGRRSNNGDILLAVPPAAFYGGCCDPWDGLIVKGSATGGEF